MYAKVPFIILVFNSKVLYERKTRFSEDFDIGTQSLIHQLPYCDDEIPSVAILQRRDGRLLIHATVLG
jgi:hypothetical protein